MGSDGNSGTIIRETEMNGTAGAAQLTEDELVQLINTAGEGTIISIDLAEGDEP